MMWLRSTTVSLAQSPTLPITSVMSDLNSFGMRCAALLLQSFDAVYIETWRVAHVERTTLARAQYSQLVSRKFVTGSVGAHMSSRFCKLKYLTNRTGKTVPMESSLQDAIFERWSDFNLSFKWHGSAQQSKAKVLPTLNRMASGPYIPNRDRRRGVTGRQKRSVTSLCKSQHESR